MATKKRSLMADEDFIAVKRNASVVDEGMSVVDEGSPVVDEGTSAEDGRVSV